MSLLNKIGLHPDLWVSLVPNGVNQRKPRHFADMFRVATSQIRGGEASYAWKVLREGVCDGCALGVAGFHDWTLDGVHLCMTRLNLLEFNTAGPMDHKLLSDVAPLRSYSGAELRALGRLAYPMRRKWGEPGFKRISWSDAIGALAGGLDSAPPQRCALYLTSRGLTNESYYSAAKAARALGINNIDSAARVCHAPSTVGLKATIGVAASTCSLQDVIESDVIVLWGTNPANNQPVLTKYLHKAKVRGAKVVVVNPYLEPGLEHYWVPSIAESAAFGTKICDLHIPVRVGGDIAFAHSVIKELNRRGALDEEFIKDHTEGFAELLTHLGAISDDDLAASSGISPSAVGAFCDLYGASESAVLIWSMGITQHTMGAEGVQAIVNVGLAKGNVGRDGAGLMPIRGHSGVQGGAEMGAYATAFPGGLAINAESAAQLSDDWGFDVSPTPGLTAPEMVDAAHDGALDVLWMSGGNFLDILPDPPRVREALERVPLRVHQDLVVTSQMLVDGEDVLLLPVRTRYEQEGGGTSTTTERRVAFSPEIPRTVGESRSEWRLFADVATQVRPELAGSFNWPTNKDLRAEIAQVVPSYAGIEDLSDTGDSVQWGGRHLCFGGDFPTDSGRALFSSVPVPSTDIPDGYFKVTTRRGKQFNTIVWAEDDPVTGATRDAVYMSSPDAKSLGASEGDRVTLISEDGEMSCRVFLAKLPSRNLQVYWPEGNVLLPGGAEHRDAQAGIPDFQALVQIHPS